MNIIKHLRDKIINFLIPEVKLPEGALVDYRKEFVDKIIREERYNHEQASSSH